MILGAVILVVAVTAAAVFYPLIRTRYQQTEKPPLPAGESADAARRLYSHAEELTVRIGPRSVHDYEALARAGDYIRERLESWGYEPVLHKFDYKGREYFNIECSLLGTRAPGQIVVIGAHYDTVEGTPGADDNASAVAVLLEMCRLMRSCSPERTIKFLFFSLEERPAFATRSMGSETYARRLKDSGADVRAMISLEMLGYFSERAGGQAVPLPLMGKGIPTTPDFIGVIGNLESAGLVKEIRRAIEEGCSVPVQSLAASRLVPGVDFSDHRSFWRMGYPAAMVTDTAFYRNPNYHTERDTIDTLDFGKMAELLKGLIKTAEKLSTLE